MKKKSLLAVPVLTAGAAAALSGFVYYQVLGRNATLYEKIADAVTGGGSDEEKEKFFSDERFVWFRQQQFKEYEMTNDRGQRLKGYLIEAETPSETFVLCSHGYRSTGKGEFKYVAKHYHDKNINVFLVDHQAAGQSEGNMISFGYYESKDLVRWTHFLKETFGENIKIILHGVSMGCATATIASASDDLPENVKFTVADCGYTSMNDQFNAVLRSYKVPSFPLVPLTGLWSKAFGKFSYSEVSPLECVKKAKVPMLFIHGADDDFVPTEMVYKLYDACTTEKDLLVVDGAIHAMSYYVNGDACNEKIDSFIEKYI